MKHFAICLTTCMLCFVAGIAYGAVTVDFSRTVSTGYPVGGGTVDVAVVFTSLGTGTLLSLGITETIPSGWTYNSLVGTVPGSFQVQPSAGSTGDLDFVWNPPPAHPGEFPFTLTYRLNVPAGQTGTKQLSGYIYYNGGTPDDTQSAPKTTNIDPAGSALSVAPSSQNVSAAAGSTTFSIQTTASWTASSNQTWATLGNPSGTGNATLTVNVGANTGAARTATITVTGTGTTPSSVQVTVNQEAAATPTLSVTPSSQNVSAAAGSTTFSIQTTASWTASSNQTWATLGNPSGTGNATLTVNVGANTGAARTATITVTGTGTTPSSVQVTVNQAGPQRWTLTVGVSPSDAGTVTLNPAPDISDGKYADGTVVNLTANAFSGNVFLSWTGAVSGTSPTVQITMNGNKSVTANFTRDTGDWNSTTVNYLFDYQNCWSRSGSVRVAGASEIRVVLGEYYLEENIDYLYIGDTAVTGSMNFGTGELTTSSVVGDTITLWLTSDASVTGYYQILRVEYRGVPSDTPVEFYGDIFGAVTDDCPSSPPCCGCSGGKGTGIEALKKSMGDFIVMLLGGAVLIAMAGRRPLGW